MKHQQKRNIVHGYALKALEDFAPGPIRPLAAGDTIVGLSMPGIIFYQDTAMSLLEQQMMPFPLQTNAVDMPQKLD